MTARAIKKQKQKETRDAQKIISSNIIYTNALQLNIIQETNGAFF